MLTSKWDHRFLLLARHISGWSKNPAERHGAVLADDLRRVHSLGYNGFPRGIEDTPERLSDDRQRTSLTISAERNALLQAEMPITGTTLYSTRFPDPKDAKSVVQRRVSRVVAPLAQKSGIETDFHLRHAQAILSEGGVRVEFIDLEALGNVQAASRGASWEHRLMTLSFFVAAWSKDPSTKVGSVISDRRRRVLSLAYNGFPRGIADTDERLTNRETKYALVHHAEANALDAAETSVLDATLYTTLFSCHECCKHIIQRGIPRIVTPMIDLNHPRLGSSFAESLRLFREAGVEILYIDPLTGATTLDSQNVVTLPESLTASFSVQSQNEALPTLGSDLVIQSAENLIPLSRGTCCS